MFLIVFNQFLDLFLQLFICNNIIASYVNISIYLRNLALIQIILILSEILIVLYILRMHIMLKICRLIQSLIDISLSIYLISSLIYIRNRILSKLLIIDSITLIILNLNILTIIIQDTNCIISILLSLLLLNYTII